jgi:SET domain-containing protein
MIDGSDGGSWATHILDYRFNPFDVSNNCTDGASPNCELVEVHVLGWPLILCVAVNDIEVGDELGLDYGTEHWMRASYVVKVLNFIPD